MAEAVQCVCKCGGTCPTPDRAQYPNLCPRVPTHVFRYLEEDVDGRGRELTLCAMCVAYRRKLPTASYVVQKLV